MVIDWICILFVVFCLLNWKLCKYFHIDFLMTQQTRLCLGGHRRKSEEACIRIRLRQSNLKRLQETCFCNDCLYIIRLLDRLRNKGNNDLTIFYVKI